MNNEWKELKIDNLPSDILTGNYEWEISQGEGWEGAQAEVNPHFRIKALEDLQCKKKCHDDLGEQEYYVEYRFRKPEPKQPTHEEIMTKWFLYSDGRWRECKGYREGIYEFGLYTHRKPYFTGMRFEEIPPESV